MSEFIALSREQIEARHYSSQFGNIELPSPEVMRQAQTEAISRQTGVLESWFVRHNAGFISSPLGRFEFSSRDIIGGDPRPGAAVTFTVKLLADLRHPVGVATAVEIEPKV